MIFVFSYELQPIRIRALLRFSTPWNSCSTTNFRLSEFVLSYDLFLYFIRLLSRFYFLFLFAISFFYFYSRFHFSFLFVFYYKLLPIRGVFYWRLRVKFFHSFALFVKLHNLYKFIICVLNITVGNKLFKCVFQQHKSLYSISKPFWFKVSVVFTVFGKFCSFYHKSLQEFTNSCVFNTGLFSFNPSSRQI